MYVVRRSQSGVTSLPAKEIPAKSIAAATSKLAQRILRLLADKPDYPMSIAKKLKVDEQKVYYHIRKLEKARIIDITRTQPIVGSTANIYSLTKPAFVVKFKDFEEAKGAEELKQTSQTIFEPFIEGGQLNATIIVGSPDPHGPEKARSRDGYYGIDFALFLGTFLNYIPKLNVKLDTEVRESDLENNLILIGGPVVNTVIGKINTKLPVYFDSKNGWAVKSKISNKTYHSDEIGIFVKTKNPFNPKKSILVIAGKRHAGTRAVIIALMNKLAELSSGNLHDPKQQARIIEGIDLDSDGIVDEVEILE